MTVSTDTASKALASLEALQIVTKVGRGKWVDPQRVSRLVRVENRVRHTSPLATKNLAAFDAIGV